MRKAFGILVCAALAGTAFSSGCGSPTPAQDVADGKNNPYADDVLGKAMFDLQVARSRSAEAERRYALGAAAYADVLKSEAEEISAALALNRSRAKLGDGDADDLADEEKTLVEKKLKNYDERLAELERVAAGTSADAERKTAERKSEALLLEKLGFKIKSARVLGLSGDEVKSLKREFSALAKKTRLHEAE